MLFCSKKECVTGTHWLDEPVPLISNGKQYVLHGHRHDQTILSVLRVRYGLLTVQKSWEFYEFRSLEHAQKKQSRFYNNNGGYEDIHCRNK